MTKCPTCKITEGTLYDDGYFYPRANQIDDDRAYAELDKEELEERELEKMEFNKAEYKRLVRFLLGMANKEVLEMQPQNLKEFKEIWGLMQRAIEVGIIKIDRSK